MKLVEIICKSSGPALILLLIGMGVQAGKFNTVRSSIEFVIGLTITVAITVGIFLLPLNDGT